MEATTSLGVEEEAGMVRFKGKICQMYSWSALDHSPKLGVMFLFKGEIILGERSVFYCLYLALASAIPIICTLHF